MPELPKLPPIADAPLSVVLLARDAAVHAAATVAAWAAHLEATRPGAHEIIVVDDASADGTADAASSVPAAHVIRLDERRGEGAALRAGLAAATKPLVFYTLCDPAYRPEMLAQLFARGIIPEDGTPAREIDHVQLMSGFRAGVRVPAPLRWLGWLGGAVSFVLFAYKPRRAPGRLGARRWLGWLLSRALFGIRHHDVACPFRLMRRELLARLPIQSDGPFAHVELMAKANFLGAMMGDEESIDVRPPEYRGDAGAFLRDAKKVFNKPDFGPAVLPVEAKPEGA